MAVSPRLLVALLLALGVAVPAVLGQAPPRNNEASLLEFFEKRVRPVLVNNCFNCHSANTNAKGGLRVDDRNGMLQGGGRGPAIVPGQPEKSLLIQAVEHTHAKLKMPQNGDLPAQQIADLKQWIKDGATWPKVEMPFTVGKRSAKYEKLRKEHWAWQPLRTTPVPEVKDPAWARADIDHFILAGLEAKGLKPVGDADPRTLIRRLTFDLTGLPPTPTEIADFELRIADLQKRSIESAIRNPQSAIQEVVDRLLASPAFGEHWGRHWLDVARYGESTGSARNLPLPHAWRYRNYVIDAFSNDKPYDQFIREQIAGDLLPARSPAERDVYLIATGFLALGVKDVNQRFKVRFIMDNIDEQIDTVSRSVLALTASCARCHDHKFDPIPTTDYYALAGIFHSSDLCAGLRNKMGGGGMDYYDPALLLRLDAKPQTDPQAAAKVEKAKAALAQARTELTALVDDPKKAEAGPEREAKLAAARKHVNQMQNNLLALTDPAATGAVAFGVRDAKTVGDTEIRIRGEAEKLGPVVPRGYLTLVDVPGAPPINPQQSGRLELAHWLTHEKNPLSSRVIVNRVWHHLFGEGIVGSVDNFGVTGDTPSHPELLDHLAAQFVRDGWSIKRLIRTLVLTRAYQLGSDATPEHVTADPANRLVWRHSPRRLTAEEIRDTMLIVAGSLDRARPEHSLANELKVTELSNVSPLAKQLEKEAANSKHRSLYLPLLRTLTPRSLEVFDFAEQGMVTGSRDATTVATQALYLMNDPLVRRQALSLADRLLQQPDLDDAGRLDLAYRLTLSRGVSAQEIERAKRYLADYEADAGQEGSQATDSRTAAWASFCQALMASAEFRFVR